MEIVKCEDIVRHGHRLRPNMTKEEYFAEEWISKKSLIEWVNHMENIGLDVGIIQCLKFELEL